jgi:putative ABC transport system permease protein
MLQSGVAGCRLPSDYSDRMAQMRVRLKQQELRELIARSSISQNHWAIKLGLSRGHWSDIVNGKHPYPSAKTRGLMLEVFRVPFEELFETDTGGWSDQDFKAAISNRYVVDREVGHGGMGTVYLARDARLGRTVAIKVVSPEAVSGIGIKQFLKEIRNTARLQHHNVLPLHDAGEAAGYPFYVMPYMRDGSLRDLLKQRERLSVDEALQIARGVASALTYAHGEQVLHCDIKPANVLLSGTHAFVADFGISRAIHAEAFEWGLPASLDTSAGTPAYVSPEQASGEHDLDGRSDVYSLSSMVFEMLAGRPPFVGANTMAVVAQRFDSKIPDLRELVPEIPIRIARSVARGMAVEQERRTASPDALIQELERGSVHHVSRTSERVSLFGAQIRARTLKLLGRAPSTSRPPPDSSRLGNRVRLMFGSFKQDITYAIRTFSRAPAFSVAVVLTLAFGIGASSFVFSLMNPYLFRPLPYGNPDRLVQLGHISQEREWDGFRFSLLQMEDYSGQSTAFDDVAIYHYGTGNLTGVEGPQRASVAEVTANMFSLLEAPAALGRTFLPEEGREVGEPVVVMAHDLWQARYGSDPDILGTTVMLDGISRTVIGIMPATFVFPFGGVDIWEPITADPTQLGRENMGSLIVGRMRQGWSIERTRQELNRIHHELAVSYPEIDGRYDGISVKPLRSALNFAWDMLKMMFLFMMASVLFALVIACVNVASLHMARGTARKGEIAVRAALGAGRGRLVRQLLTESALLAVVGGVLGVLLARWGAGFVGALIPEDLYRIGTPSLDVNVLAFSVGITAVTILVFGLAPAFAATRTDLSVALKDGGRGGRGVSSQRARRALVVFETAMAVTLICGMGLMMRSFRAIEQVDLGFQVAHQTTFPITLPSSDYPDRGEIDAFYRRAVEEVRMVPVVNGVGTVAHVPQNHESSGINFAPLSAMPALPEDWPEATSNYASPGYFEAMGITLLGGRDFEAGDGPDAPHVVVVSQSLADAHWPVDGPVGQTLLVGGPAEPLSATVVGVVGDVIHEGNFADDSRPQLYQCSHQNQRRRQFLIVSSEGAPTAIVNPVRQALLRVDPNLPVGSLTMAAIVGQNKLPWSISSKLLGVLGTAGLLLASLGIYGVIAYSVAQRRREIGVRIALGASSNKIRYSFLSEGLKLSAVGALIGLALAILAGKGMSSLLFGVSAFDPPTIIGTFVVFALVAAAASLLPAVRASKVDVAEVLRAE